MLLMMLHQWMQVWLILQALCDWTVTSHKCPQTVCVYTAHCSNPMSLNTCSMTQRRILLFREYLTYYCNIRTRCWSPPGYTEPAALRAFTSSVNISCECYLEAIFQWLQTLCSFEQSHTDARCSTCWGSAFKQNVHINTGSRKNRSFFFELWWGSITTLLLAHSFNKTHLSQKTLKSNTFTGRESLAPYSCLQTAALLIHLNEVYRLHLSHLILCKYKAHT